MNKKPEAVPMDMQGDINSLKARVTALEAWVAWFKAYLDTHPGGVSISAIPKPGELEQL
jgi:hypothetical protein